MTYEEFKNLFGKDDIICFQCMKCEDVHFISGKAQKGTFDMRNKCYACLPDKPEIKVYKYTQGKI